MKEQKDRLSIRTVNDSVHPRRYQLELEAIFYCDFESAQIALKSAGYKPITLDEKGVTYSSNEDPNLFVDLDVTDRPGKIQLILKKDNLVKTDVNMSKKYLSRTYHQIINGISTEN